MTIGTAHEGAHSLREATTRADLAQALVDLTWNNPTLAGAIATHEAWHSGYVGRLLASAEVLAATWNDDFGATAPMPAAEAVRRAVENANPRATGALGGPIGRDAHTALIELLLAQAAFHQRASGLERRGLRRTPAF